MTQDEIIEMARQSGLVGKPTYTDGLVAFAKLVAQQAQAEERGACANVAEQVGQHKNQHGIAAAIRARGQA